MPPQGKQDEKHECHECQVSRIHLWRSAADNSRSCARKLDSGDMTQDAAMQAMPLRIVEKRQRFKAHRAAGFSPALTSAWQ
jgi:hypothetical protein